MAKLLIVEDDKYYSQTLQRKFEELGYEVQIAENGQVMLDMLPKFTPDLILLDLVMPVMSGFEALEKMQALGNKTKVIVLSNLGQESDIEKAEQLGAIDYVIKTNASIHDVVDLVSNNIA